MYTYTGAIKAAGSFKPKARLWAAGRRGIYSRLRSSLAAGDRVVWIHAASLGEFEQGRPVIEAIRESYPQYKILLTFFSPSGYEIRRDYRGVDWVFYLPSDTPSNVRKFLDAVNPEIAIFIKYEFWLNYLGELKKRGVPTYIISAVFRRDSIFFRPYGGAFRRALGSFTRIFVQDGQSRDLLNNIGIDNVTIAGDTRFDRVAIIAREAKALPSVERFAAGGKVLVSGSTWPADEAILLRLAEDNPDLKLIIAPHETDRGRIEKLVLQTGLQTVLYTCTKKDQNNADSRIMIIDTIGILSSVYRYGHYGYVGGGFGSGIHNTLEAAVYGLPLAFGPNYQKFIEAGELVASGAACAVENYEALSDWYKLLSSDQRQYERSCRAAGSYVESHTGATQIIVKTIFENL